MNQAENRAHPWTQSPTGWRPAKDLFVRYGGRFLIETSGRYSIKLGGLHIRRKVVKGVIVLDGWG